MITNYLVWREIDRLVETEKQSEEPAIVYPGSTEGSLRSAVQIPVVGQSSRVSASLTSPSNPEPVMTKEKSAISVKKLPTGSERRKVSRRIGVYHSPESAKNEKIRHGLEAIYGLEKTRTVLEQATTIYHVNNPLSLINPELYELFETGVIDAALEFFGQSWVIGRVKLD